MSEGVGPACPRCGSLNSVVRGGKFLAIAGICILGISSLVIFVIPPVGISGIILGLVLLVYSPFAKPFRHCSQCKRFWRNSR